MKKTRKNNKLGIDNFTWREILSFYPSLRKCESITEASKVIYGVKSLSSEIEHFDGHSIAQIKEFFGQDHSSLIDWFKNRGFKYSTYFYASPNHRLVYKRMIRDFGLEVAVSLTESRDFPDLVTGYEFLKADKKRWKKFETNILAELYRFPRGAHSVMIHDYIDQKMKAEERKARPSLPAVSDIPLAPITVAEAGKFKVLVPTSSRDLRRIGTAQSHCVGTAGMGYADKIRRGTTWIFALYSKTLSDGVCVEVREGTVVQVQGKHRRSGTAEEYQAIEVVLASIAA